MNWFDYSEYGLAFKCIDGLNVIKVTYQCDQIECLDDGFRLLHLGFCNYTK